MKATVLVTCFIPQAFQQRESQTGIYTQIGTDLLATGTVKIIYREKARINVSQLFRLFTLVIGNVINSPVDSFSILVIEGSVWQITIYGRIGPRLYFLVQTSVYTIHRIIPLQPWCQVKILLDIERKTIVHIL